MAGRLGSGAGRRPGLGFHWVRSQWDWGDCREWGWGGVQVTAGRLVCRVQAREALADVALTLSR